MRVDKQKKVTIDQLLEEIISYHPRPNKKLIRQAYDFADRYHRGQKRLSGEPVINHSLSVAGIVVDWRLDSASVAAALLHDVVEDTPAKVETIKKKFGQEMASLVDGLTRVSRVRLRGSNNEQFIENLRKMFLAMSRDLRVDRKSVV